MPLARRSSCWSAWVPEMVGSRSGSHQLRSIQASRTSDLKVRGISGDGDGERTRRRGREVVDVWFLLSHQETRSGSKCVASLLAN